MRRSVSTENKSGKRSGGEESMKSAIEMMIGETLWHLCKLHLVPLCKTVTIILIQIMVVETTKTMGKTSNDK